MTTVAMESIYWELRHMLKRRRKTQPEPELTPATPPVSTVPADSPNRVATAEETAARLATLTEAERELLEWGKQQKPMSIGCIRGSYTVDIDFYLAMYGLQQHVQQCLELEDEDTDTTPATCTHMGIGAPFPSRLNALLADLPGPDAGRWTAAALAHAMRAQGVAVHPGYVAAFSRGDRGHPGSAVAAAAAQVLGVPVTYFEGRAVRLTTDPATGGDMVVEELYDSAGQPNRCPGPAL